MSRASYPAEFVRWDASGYHYRKLFRVLADAVTFAKGFDGSDVIGVGHAGYEVRFTSPVEVLA
ncbi:hypothetical protein ACH0BU_17905 [Sphingomonas olei]